MDVFKAQVFDRSVVLQQSNVQQMQVQSVPVNPVNSQPEKPPAQVTVEIKPVAVQAEETKKIEPVGSQVPKVVEKLNFQPKEEPVLAQSTTIKTREFRADAQCLQNLEFTNPFSRVLI